MITAKALQSHIKKSSGKLFINDVDGKQYWSDSYILAPVTEPVTSMLSEFNLDAKNGNYYVTTTITTSDAQPPQFHSLLAEDKKAVELTPKMIGGKNAYAIIEEGKTEILVAAYEGVGIEDIYINKSKLDLLGVTGTHTLKGSGPTNAVTIDLAGEFVGIIMPIRCN
jgi:hypothetical protein